MKIALCFYGLAAGLGDKAQDKHMRKVGKHCPDGIPVNWKAGYPGIKKHILDVNDVDVFMHTWSTQAHKELEATYQPKRIVTEKQRWFFPKLKKIDKSTGTLVSRQQVAYSRWYSQKRALQLKHEYEVANNFQYDFVMVIRYDIGWRSNLDFSQFDQSKFYVSNWCRYHRKNSKRELWFQYQFDECPQDEMVHDHYDATRKLPDLWFFSSSATMDKFGELFDMLPALNTAWSGHLLSFAWLKKLGLATSITQVFHSYKDYMLTRCFV